MNCAPQQAERSRIQNSKHRIQEPEFRIQLLTPGFLRPNADLLTQLASQQAAGANKESNATS
jgi:hypothetical protein